MLADTLGLHCGIGRQHADVSAGLVTLHMHTCYELWSETQEQNRGLFVK